MNSVARWASANGWDYECMDDSFFDLVSPEILEKCVNNIYALTDICRLVLLTQKLEASYDRVVWADADFLIFSPDRLKLVGDRDHGFAREIFLQVNEDGSVTPIHGLNNALMYFTLGSPMLQHYLGAALAVIDAAQPGEIERTALGPHLLRSIAQSQSVNLIDGVGLLTMSIMREIELGKSPMFQFLERLSGHPLGAANLCHFLRNATTTAMRVKFDQTYLKATHRLLKQGSGSTFSEHVWAQMLGDISQEKNESESISA